jgi:hypothetical protein
VARGAASSSNRALYDSRVLAPRKSVVLVVTADSPRVSALQKKMTKRNELDLSESAYSGQIRIGRRKSHFHTKSPWMSVKRISNIYKSLKDTRSPHNAELK